MSIGTKEEGNRAYVSGSQVSQEMRRRVLAGMYAPGGRLPPERELELEFGCSRLTVARALMPLVQDGLLQRFRGRGTFVVDREGQGKARHATTMGRGERLPDRGNVVKYVSPAHRDGTSRSRDEVLAGLHTVLDEAGYHVSVDFYDDLEQYIKCLAKASDLQIAGLVVWPALGEGIIEAMTALMRQGVPLVLADNYLRELECDHAVSDNVEGAAAMVRHLAELGHRRICYLTMPTNPTSLVDRLSGFLRGMVEHGLPVDSSSVVRLSVQVGAPDLRLQPTDLTQQIDALLALPDPPTALFASHDILAMSAMAHLQLRGVSVPKQMTVVGYDGTEIGEFGAVPLTTMKQDFLAMARTAARILIERFDSRNSPLRHQAWIKPQLVVRASSATPARP